jgi:phosphate transport system substrate-binding protein
MLAPVLLAALALVQRTEPVAPGDGRIALPPGAVAELIDSLPADRIEVLGPPPTSGTRDAFLELGMEPGCQAFASLKTLKTSDSARFKQVCHAIREDGFYVEAGENDNLIVQKLQANPKALGIFGYSFLEQNVSQLQGSTVNGVVPTFDNIADGKYPVSRAMFIYVKEAHLGVIPGLREFITEYVSERAMGDFGYLADKGLVPLPVAEMARVRAAVLQKIK